MRQQHGEGILLKNLISELDSNDTQLDYLAVNVHCNGFFFLVNLPAIRLVIFVEELDHLLVDSTPASPVGLKPLALAPYQTRVGTISHDLRAVS